MQAKVTKTLLIALLDPAKPLATHYGALEALAGLGPGVVASVLVPNVPSVLKHLVPIYEGAAAAAGGAGAGAAGGAPAATPEPPEAAGADAEMRDADAPGGAGGAAAAGSDAERKRAARRQREAGKCLEVLMAVRAHVTGSHPPAVARNRCCDAASVFVFRFTALC